MELSKMIEELSLYEKKEVCPDCGKEPCECKEGGKCESVEEGLTPEKYQEEVRRIINNDFEAVRKELWELTKAFKEQYPGYNTYQLPMADRDIGALAEVAGILLDLLDDKKRGTGMEKKLRKALGYNG